MKNFEFQARGGLVVLYDLLRKGSIHPVIVSQQPLSAKVKPYGITRQRDPFVSFFQPTAFFTKKKDLEPAKLM